LKLLTKFNLILLVLFGLGGLLISFFAYQYRDYTTTDLSPLLIQNPQHRVHFLAETVPAFAATTTHAVVPRLRWCVKLRWVVGANGDMAALGSGDGVLNLASS
jgi:hypothetical protein